MAIVYNVLQSTFTSGQNYDEIIQDYTRQFKTSTDIGIASGRAINFREARKVHRRIWRNQSKQNEHNVKTSFGNSVCLYIYLKNSDHDK